ncbi:sensor histidine kinase [Oribacterium sp. WCC10]|uniref:sensor histidine kinase n=1 Tax=Oribacterium sp. WCC10 TaxID=1855343 RepID=UPI0008E2C589|nr:sensor histidine kinase [Oribacterium sp. WCC10]SFG63899.1 Histidine kinase-, DNA gyrase B-, and HSP90-like ATPase [Oribacterium sp. WCC10]
MGFIRQSFKRQIFAVFLSVTLILVISVGILTIQAFQARVKLDYESRDIEQQKYVTDHISQMIDMANAAMDLMEENEVIKESLTTGRNKAQDVYSELYEATRDIRSFAVADIYVGSTCRYSTGSEYITNRLPDYYSALREASRNRHSTIYSLSPGNASDAGSELLMVRQIIETFDPVFIVIRLGQNEIKNQIKDGINAKDGFILANRYFRPFCLIGTAENGVVLSEIRKNLLSSRVYNYGMNDNIYIKELGDTNILSIYITPPVLEASAVNAGYRMVMLLALASVVICLFVASKFSVVFSKPINELYSAMKRFRKGDFDTKIVLDREDEFEQLAVGFNKMTTQLKETMEEQVKAERRVNETRIAMMQAQLNPHFLYNTLDTIKWVAKANQVPEVATLSASLAGILRYSISGNQFCKLEKELEMIRKYCDIQRIRFDDCFDLSVDVDGKLLDAVVPKLILQPLVENAIIHGMDGQNDGHLEVRVYDGEDSQSVLYIEIEDNGKGISDEYIRALENDDIETLKGHLGLNNVNTIIRMYYGKEYGIHAERLAEKGTLVTVKVPLYYSVEEINR